MIGVMRLNDTSRGRLRSASRAGVLALAAWLVVAPAAQAMSVQPMLIDLRAGRGNMTGSVTVTNSFAAAMPVELNVAPANVGENGEIVRLAEESEDFVVFPPQALLQPGQSQTFRLQWLGDPGIVDSQTYVVTAAQLPVDAPEGQATVQIVYNFQFLANIAPSVGEPDLRVVEASMSRAESGGATVNLLVANDGIAHGYLSGARLRLSVLGADGQRIWQRLMEPEEVGSFIGYGLIQDGAQRRFGFPIPVPEGIEGTLRVEIAAYTGLR